MTNMPDRQRLPRERLSETVRAIARDVARQETHTARCRNYWGDSYEASFRIVALWAFGSWARGAPTCGDVDLIVDFERLGDAPSTPSAVANAVRRRRRYVDLHVGTPDQLAEVAVDAVLIWSPEHPDHEAAIGAIPANQGAGRHARPLDVLPLDARRLGMPFDLRDKLPIQIAAGVLEVCWRPATEIPPLDPALVAWAGRISLGEAARRVLPLAAEELLRWMNTEDVRPAWMHSSRGIAFAGRGVKLCIERWHHDLHDLDHLGCSALVVVPHWKARGPNGVLVLTRGVCHPLVERFKSIGGWVEGDGFVRMGWTARHEHFRIEGEALVLELFTSRSAAESRQAEWEEREAGPLRRLSETDLLRAIDRADVVTVDEAVDVAITHHGARYLRDTGIQSEVDEPSVDLLLRLLTEG